MADIQHILAHYWGHSTFRPLQQEIIESVLARQDTLALLPTGGGKSICFQVPALAKDGICIVVSPLIALMQDQVDQLTQRGIPAIAIYSGMSNRQIDILLDNCIYGSIKFLYVSPERLKTDLFIARAKQMQINLLVIDEAHCISQWGYDFRPAYLEILNFKLLLPETTPCIALTASANLEVQQDILAKLQLKNPKVFQKSFQRPNLSYSCLWVEDKEPQLFKMLKKVGGSSIVYARNRRKTQEIATYLQKEGIKADFYHAGLDPAQRTNKQKAWISNQIQCIVATNAFGMGIDKPDVRLVVHVDLPDSIEAYYQEAGRAGRDEQKAYAVAMVEENDLIELQKNWEKSFPSADVLQKTYQAMSNFLQIAEGSGELSTYDFDWTEMARRFQLPTSETFYALKTLESEGLFLMSDAFQNPSKIKIQVNATELYDFQIRNEKFESFLKFLLRQFGGNLYTQFVSISEASLSIQLKVPVEEIERYLTLLAKFEIIEYEKQNGLPKLTLLTPRANIDNLPITWSEYLQKKERSKSKMDAIESYVRDQKTCRTRKISAYFGEQLNTNCGICDVCIQQKKEQSGRAYPEGQAPEQKLILNYLKNGPMNISDLTDCLRPLTRTEAAKMIQYCLEAGQITYTSTDTVALASS
jgi:ATP-dependent DNA helicase RecQ